MKLNLLKNENAPIGTGAGKHLVDTQNVERVHANAQVESFLAGGLGHVLVDGDTGSLQSLGGQLLLLTGNQVHDGRELIGIGALLADIVNADLGV